MNELQAILGDTANRLFTDKLGKGERIAAEDAGWLPDLWQAVEENGFPRILVSEIDGGAGATWEEAAILLRAVGAHAVPLPLAETILAAWLLDCAGIEPPEGPIALAEAELSRHEGSIRAQGVLAAVPYAAQCGHIAAVAPADGGVRVALFAAGETRTPTMSLAREPRADVTLSAPALADGVAALPGDAVELFGALARAAGISGALEAVLGQAVQYAGERVQFGRPIAKFQAIQHQLAELASGTASVAVAVDSAARAVARDPMTAAFEIAVAKVRAADAAQAGAGIAHQTDGAIGFTYEHGLHFWTRRLWSWAPEYGGAAHWAAYLGRHAIAAGGEALWPEITAR